MFIYFFVFFGNGMKYLWDTLFYIFNLFDPKKKKNRQIAVVSIQTSHGE